MLPAVPKLLVKDPELLRVQDRVHDGLQALLKVPISDGVLLTNVTIGTAATTVKHGLARLPRGWIVVATNTGAQVAETRSGRTSSNLVLTAGGTTVADLWVF